LKFLEKYESYLEKIRNWYVVIFITYLLLSRVVLFVNIISIPANSMIYNLLAVSGIVILVWDFFTHFYQFKSKENLILVGFLVVCAISTLLNIQYGLGDNLKTLVWTSIQFFLMFSILHVKDFTYVKKMLSRIMNITSIIWFVTTVFSLLQFIFVVKYKADFASYPRRQGFIDSRLFGIYSDPNFAAVTSHIVIVFAVFICKNTTSKAWKRLQLANIVCQLLYIILSGSRTGHIELTMVMFILGYSFVRSYCLKKNIKKYYVKGLVMAVLLSILSVSGVAALQKPLLSIAEFGESIKKAILYDDDESGQVDEQGNPIPPEEEEEITLDREDVKEDDISNNRFAIWQGAIDVASDARIFGVSPRNLIPYAQENDPEGYIATTGYETHSGYVALFVNTGIAGVTVMLGFVGYMVYLFVKYLKVNRKKVYQDEFIICVCVVAIVAVSAVMLLDIFFVNTFSAAIFWLSAGYFTYIAKSEIKKSEQ